MSWERAETHTCADGFVCRGHKVNVVYEKQKDGYYKGETMRIPYCERCKQSCSTETITNQNYRDMTGRKSAACFSKKKKAIPCKVWRDAETGKTMKEMMKDLADIKKKYNLE